MRCGFDGLNVVYPDFVDVCRTASDALSNRYIGERMGVVDVASG